MAANLRSFTSSPSSVVCAAHRERWTTALPRYCSACRGLNNPPGFSSRAILVAITHRVGVCEIGEASVAIAVSAPHRQDALAACKDAIDTLKETVPKKEVYEGGEEWIGRGS